MRPLTDGAVDYTSSSMVVAIESDTGYTTLHFYRLQDGRTYYITPIDIHEYLNTSEMEKKLLLSTDTAGRLAASSLANEKLLLNQPAWKASHGTLEDLEREFRNFAAWIQEHAGLCVAGDFSRWPAIYEYKINRARADSLRRGKSELVRELIKDADGNFKTVMRPIYTRELEHVEKLKKECTA